MCPGNLFVAYLALFSSFLDSGICSEIFLVCFPGFAQANCT